MGAGVPCRARVLAALLAMALGGCGQAAANDRCVKEVRARHQQERHGLTARLRALEVSRSGAGLKDRQAVMDLMTEIEAAENRYKVMIRNCHAQN